MDAKERPLRHRVVLLQKNSCQISIKIQQDLAFYIYRYLLNFP